MAEINDRQRNNSIKTKMSTNAALTDIQHKIDDQIRMREGAVKLMSACSTLNQALETSKNLLTINARILGLMTALQREKKQHVLEEYNRQESTISAESIIGACKGRVSISDIRVPLMWKDNVHFTGKTGDQAYYAFALIRCGDQVRDTPLYEVTSADTDMYFEDPLIFDELVPDFKMDFEIYYTVITSNESHGVRPPVRTHMHLRTNKRAIHFKAPKFCLAGHKQFTIEDVQTNMISRDLVMGGQGASGVAVLGDITEFPIHPMELWGQICCKLTAEPRCMLEDGLCGTAKVSVDGTWQTYYCRIYPSAISCWIGKEHMLTKPSYVMSYTDVNKVSHIEEENTVVLISASSNSTLHSLRFDNSQDCLDWLFALRSAIINFQSWKVAVTECMHIELAKKHRLSIPTQASFYEQIEIDSLKNNVFNNDHVTPPVEDVHRKLKQISEKTDKQPKNSSKSLPNGAASLSDDNVASTDATVNENGFTEGSDIQMKSKPELISQTDEVIGTTKISEETDKQLENSGEGLSATAPSQLDENVPAIENENKSVEGSETQIQSTPQLISESDKDIESTEMTVESTETETKTEEKEVTNEITNEVTNKITTSEITTVENPIEDADNTAPSLNDTKTVETTVDTEKSPVPCEDESLTVENQAESCSVETTEVATVGSDDQLNEELNKDTVESDEFLSAHECLVPSETDTDITQDCSNETPASNDVVGENATNDVVDEDVANDAVSENVVPLDTLEGANNDLISSTADPINESPDEKHVTSEVDEIASDPVPILSEVPSEKIETVVEDNSETVAATDHDSEENFHEGTSPTSDNQSDDPANIVTKESNSDDSVSATDENAPDTDTCDKTDDKKLVRQISLSKVQTTV